LILMLPIWLLERRAALAKRIAEKVQLNWRTVPLNDVVVARIRTASDDNRTVYLLSALPMPWARDLANGLPNTKLLVAEDTGSAAISRFGARGFDYIGDGRSDLSACRAARQVSIVGSNHAATKSDQGFAAEHVLAEPKADLLAYLRMIRVHQWLKNGLIWVPLLAAHRLTSLTSIGTAMVAFMAFSFCASFVYVLNDLLDLESDRVHIRKRNRPIAAGRITVNQALLVGLLLLAAAVALALQISALFTLTLGIYFVMTLAYSLRLKRQIVVDVMLLAGLYTIRVIAGAAASLVIPSFWLLALSMFLFLSLAVVKRYSEMLVTLAQEKQYAAGRGYSIADLPVLLSLGVSAGIAAIVVLALFINDSSTVKLYPSIIWLWPVPPLMLYWISRVWMKAHRGEMHDDPVVFAMRDWQSLLTLLLVGLCFGAATMA
jgi:4-hydroxybenzoate polyprenyltransferase